METIHDLNLRNVAGRICYDIEREAVSIPLILESGKEANGCPYVIKKAGVVNGTTKKDIKAVFDKGMRLKPLIQPIAASTCIGVNRLLLAEPKRLPGIDWLNLPAEPLWIDDTEPVNPHESTIIDKRHTGYTPLFTDTSIQTSYFVCTDEFLYGSKIHEESVRNIMVICFGSKKHRAFKRLMKAPYYSSIDGPFIMISLFPNNEFNLAVYDFNKMDLDNPVLWPESERTELYISYIAAFVISVLFTLNVANNVTLQRIAPARHVPKYERKYPRLEYHVLKLNRSSGAVSPKLEKQLRKSPRQHLRRGHLRQYRPGKYTWIPHCMIGKWESGNIVKDYLI